MARRGRFISFEGGEGAGKSTHIAGLADHLRDQGHTVVVTREPGGTKGAEAIRKLIVTGDGDRWSAQAELLLLLAARRDHVERVIEPALARGSHVLCDRFSDSTVAYQGAARRLGADRVAALDAEWGAGGLVPDLTVLLDLDVTVGLDRTLGRSGDETRFEGLDIGFHEALRQAFLARAAADPDRFAVIDAGESLDVVGRAVIAAATGRLGL